MGIRPSELYGVHDEWLAFCFDRAVVVFGGALRDELESVESKTKEQGEHKRMLILAKWLGEKPKFADPADRMKKG
jgi:hypothetical protein